MNKIKKSWLGLLILFMPITVLAGDFDGSKPLVCAVLETFESAANGECLRGESDSIAIPPFLKINFQNKMISGTLEGETRTTQIESLQRKGGRVILQGVQEGKAWSLIISEETGKMTLTASDIQVGFVVFGACTPD